MATIMEKDVLIEGVAQALGYLQGTNNEEDRKKLLAMRKLIYSSKPEALDYRSMVDYIKTIIQTYRGL